MKKLVLLVAGFAGVLMGADSSFTVTIKGKGPAMLFIPGLSSPGAVWDTTVARFEDRYECHVLTLAGFAGAGPVEGLTLNQVRADIAAYIREKKLGQPVIAGHSLGGFLAMWIAATEPSVAGPVIVVDSLPFLPAVWMPGATVQSVESQAQMMKNGIAGMSAEGWAKYQKSNPALKMMISSQADIERATEWGVQSSPGMVAQSMFDLFQTDLRPELGKIKSQVIVLAALKGVPDTAFAQYEEQYKGLEGVKLVRFPEARHFIMFDDLEGMLKTMDSFLKGNR